MQEHDIEPLDEKPVRKFGGAHPRAGRPLGALNRITADIKQGLLDGLLTCDYALDSNDKTASGSIATYMRNFANKHPEIFFSAVVKLIPRELHTSLRQESTLDITYRTVNEVRRALEESGMPLKQIEAIAAMAGVGNGEPVDEETREDVEDILLDRDRL